MLYNENNVLDILALALDDNTSDHRLSYLMCKLRIARTQPLNLDSENEAIKLKMQKLLE